MKKNYSNKKLWLLLGLTQATFATASETSTTEPIADKSSQTPVVLEPENINSELLKTLAHFRANLSPDDQAELEKLLTRNPESGSETEEEPEGSEFAEEPEGGEKNIEDGYYDDEDGDEDEDGEEEDYKAFRSAIAELSSLPTIESVITSPEATSLATQSTIVPNEEKKSFFDRINKHLTRKNLFIGTAGLVTIITIIYRVAKKNK